MKAPSRGFVVALLLIGAVCVGVGFLGRGSTSDSWFHTRAGREEMNLAEIANAVQNYQKELKSDPPVPVAQFFASLRGKNARGISVLGPAKMEDSESGIRCDAWRTPYQVFRGGTGWLIRSAGRNRVFDDLCGKGTDDMTVTIPTIEKQQAEQVGQGGGDKPSN
jgi:hypothetical protein